MDELLDSARLLKLNQEYASNLNRPITKEKIKTVIKKLSNKMLGSQIE